jgi:ankyrin repeat protein
VFLISSGSDVRIVDDEGKTALHKAAEQGHGTTFKILNQELTTKYATVNINSLLDNKGKSPFDYLPVNLKQSLNAS